MNAYPDPADPSGDTTWPPPALPWPSLRSPRPGDDDMPVPTPYPTPSPRPGPFRMSLRIGHAPRLPRRERAARVFDRCGNYALGWAAVAAAGWAAYWGLWVASVVVPYLASVLCSPWRPKRPARPVRPGSARVVHSLLLRAGGRARRGRLSPLPLG